MVLMKNCLEACVFFLKDCVFFPYGLFFSIVLQFGVLSHRNLYKVIIIPYYHYCSYSGLTNDQISNQTLVVKYHGRKHLPSIL